jgi:hypothetical protein
MNPLIEKCFLQALTFLEGLFASNYFSLVVVKSRHGGVGIGYWRFHERSIGDWLMAKEEERRIRERENCIFEVLIACLIFLTTHHSAKTARCPLTVR